MKNKLLGVCLCTIFLTGCGLSNGQVSVQPYEQSETENVSMFQPQVSAPEKSDESVYSSDDTMIFMQQDTELSGSSKNSKVFDDTFNSYYHLEDGEAVADVSNGTEITDNSDTIEWGSQQSSASSTQVKEESTEISTEDKNVINFVDGNTSVTRDTETQSGTKYATLPEINTVVDSTNKQIALKNDTGYDVQYVFSESGKELFNTGKIKPGETVNWDVYSTLEAGNHTVDYSYEQSSNGNVIVAYQTTATITVNK